MQKITSILRIDQTLFDSADTIGALRQLIRTNEHELIEHFKHSTPILELIAARSDFIDALLSQCWRQLLGADADRLALVAVGGYGRRELHPYSDIDILILLDDDQIERYEAAISALFTLLWDIGLKPGQSVRTVADCVEAARQDQTIMTTLIEARLVAGSKALFDALKEQTGPDQIWPSQQFFLAKMHEQKARYAKYNGTGYNLEPNVKEGPGGLRDIQLIAWVIKRHYNSRTLYELVAHGCLTEAEYDELMSAQKFLWKVRFGLQMLTGRCEDRLLFDHQKPLAALFGFHDSKEAQAVEKFMQEYYRTVMGLERLNEMLLQLIREMIFNPGEPQHSVPINSNFRAVHGHIEATHPKVFAENPLALLEIFLLLQQNSALTGIRAATIRLIRQHLYLIDDAFRNSRCASGLFMDILRQPRGITHELRRMNRYGVLAAYLPAFAHIVGRMQYDLFHAYTVDEHSLILVRNLRHFALDKHNHELPFCNSVFMLIPKPELLYIAGLLHDIAKGKGGDHSLLGEQVAETFCRRHGLTQHDSNLVCWLVRNHLLMSMTAQRKDISDQEVVLQFASQVKSEEYLNYLYLLTVADIRATNPALWNSWKDSLLRELYVATYRAFHRGLQKPVEQGDIIRITKAEAKSLLSGLGLNNATIQRVWQTLGNDYFIRYSADEIAWHTIAISRVSEQELPLVLLRPQNQRGTAEIFLYAKNKDSIFSDSTAVLDQLGLTILEARLTTSKDGRVLNSYQLLEQSNEPIRDLYREQQICNKLRLRILDPAACPLKMPRARLRCSKYFQTQTRVRYHDDPQHRYTVIEIISTDRPGLLSRVARAFIRLQARVHSARIATIGNRAEDIFCITDRNGQPIISEAVKQALRQAIIEELNPLNDGYGYR